MDDQISRQAAIDALSVGKEALNRVLDEMDIVGTDREKYSWGLGLIESSIKDIEELPPAQPEIIRCKDCGWWSPMLDSLQGRCALHGSYPTGAWFCGNARRK